MIISAIPQSSASAFTARPYGLEPAFFRHALRMAMCVLLPSLLLWLLSSSHVIEADWFVRWMQGRGFQMLFGHWVCPLILWFFAAALSYLIAKSALLRDERAATMLLTGQVLPRARQNTVPGESGADVYNRIRLQILSLRPKTTASHLFLTRLHEELAGASGMDSEAMEANETVRMQASFSLPRYVVWAIPMWGLIGTVIGISEAVSHFSHAMNGTEGQAGGVAAALQQHLPLVTGGLASAFDATFIALFLSLPVMLLVTWLEKEEEGYLLEVKEQWQKALPILRELRAPERAARTALTILAAPSEVTPPSSQTPERELLGDELRLLVLQVKALQETMSDLRETRSMH